jgi:hypothetical protein
MAALEESAKRGLDFGSPLLRVRRRIPMRKRHALHPKIMEWLEDRLVPSLASAPAPIVVPCESVPLPPLFRYDVKVPGAGDESRPSSLWQVLRDIRGAFTTFLNDYFHAVPPVFLGASQHGQIDALADRSTFDADVTAALQVLDGRLSDIVNSVNSDPASSTLTVGIHEAILGDGPDSLKRQLAALPTPAGSHASMFQEFTRGTFQAVGDVLALIMQDVAQILDSSSWRD